MQTRQESNLRAEFRKSLLFSPELRVRAWLRSADRGGLEPPFGGLEGRCLVRSATDPREVPVGIEPTTLALQEPCSSDLSYGTIPARYLRGIEPSESPRGSGDGGRGLNHRTTVDKAGLEPATTAL